jgi:hypothetical protein
MKIAITGETTLTTMADLSGCCWEVYTEKSQSDSRIQHWAGFRGKSLKEEKKGAAEKGVRNQ